MDGKAARRAKELRDMITLVSYHMEYIDSGVQYNFDNDSICNLQDAIIAAREWVENDYEDHEEEEIIKVKVIAYNETDCVDIEEETIEVEVGQW